MFYKNFLYVTTQFFFGFYSAFSGQPLYEKVIYQLYNITFTSFPVMWLAVFDYEHNKDRPEDKDEKSQDEEIYRSINSSYDKDAYQ